MKTVSLLRVLFYIDLRELFFTNASLTPIELYHLDHYKIVDRRQQLYETIKRKLAQADEKLRHWRDNADMIAQQSLVEVVEELRKFMLAEQPYSAVAKRAVMALRGSYAVAEFVLLGP
jgi:guanylate kinase